MQFQHATPASSKKAAAEPEEENTAKSGKSNSDLLDKIKDKIDTAVENVQNWWEDLIGPTVGTDESKHIQVGSTTIGPFLGTTADPNDSSKQIDRATLIATRLEERNGKLDSPKVEANGGNTVVSDAKGAVFTVTRADGEAGGFYDTRLAAWSWVSALTGQEIPAEVKEGSEDTLSSEENEALLTIRSQGVQAQADHTILVQGIRIGPFTGTFEGNPRSEVIASRLAEVPAAELRGARAEGARVLVGETSFELLPADAAAMGKKDASEAALEVVALLTGTWRAGAGELKEGESRQVFPSEMSDAFLFEYTRALAEGPGRSEVSTEPNQVTLVALRGVSPDGVYAPVSSQNAVDDTVIALSVDKTGKRLAHRFKATVDPSDYGRKTGTGSSHVGDVAHDYKMSQMNSGPLQGTAALEPVGAGVETRNASNQLKAFDERSGDVDLRTDTKIHMGSSAEYSQGCTVILDNKVDTNTGKSLKNISSLDASTRGMSSAELESWLAENPSEAGNRLLEIRRTEEALRAGQSTDLSAKMPNYESFMSMVYRDPELMVRYVVIDGSKLPQLPESLLAG